MKLPTGSAAGGIVVIKISGDLAQFDISSGFDAAEPAPEDPVASKKKRNKRKKWLCQKIRLL